MSSSAGAVTWGNGMTGISGIVSSLNSAVGSTANDLVGLIHIVIVPNQEFRDIPSVVPLANGNYVVGSPLWDNGSAVDAGAVTWGNGTTGIAGAVSQANSIVGNKTNDSVGITLSVALTNGNYVAISPNWSNGLVTSVGAVTWGNGGTGITGLVSQANSLVGSKTSDEAGSGGVTALNNGNYVVSSPFWSNGATQNVGAVTWSNGGTGITGMVSQANSLVGSKTSDEAGSGGVTALNNGNYVVSSPFWSNGATQNVGAVTWSNGATGIIGAVSQANSLVGGETSDEVGAFGATALTNGNYVVRSPFWNNGAIQSVGAVTWGNGATGIIGTVSQANSLVSSKTSDEVGAFLGWRH